MKLLGNLRKIIRKSMFNFKEIEVREIIRKFTRKSL